MLDHGAQFTHVAGPVVGHQGGHGVFAQRFEGLAIGVGQVLQEVLGEQRDVALALAQRGHVNGDHPHAPVEVFAELAFLDHLGQVLVRGCDHAHVHLDRLAAAHPFNGVLAQGAQQLHLRAGVDLADFVQHQGAAIGQFKPANALFRGSGESTFLVAEQFALQQLRRKGGAVNDDQLLLRPAAQVVQRPGHQLLAGAALAFNQNRGARGRHLLDGFDDRLHHLRLAEDALHGVLALHLLLEGDVLDLQLAAAQGAFDQEIDLIKVQRLGDEVVGAAAHGLHCGVHRAIRGHHDHHWRPGHAQRGLQKLHAVVIAQPQIGQHHVHRLILQHLHRIRRVGRDIDVEIVLQRLAQAVASVLFVIDDEDGGEVLGHGEVMKKSVFGQNELYRFRGHWWL